MVHPAPFFLLRLLAPPPPVSPAATIVRRAPPVHHGKPSRCTVPPPSLIKPNPVESPPPPLKSFENRWGLKPTSLADRLRFPPLPPGPYKRAPHPRPSSSHKFSLSSPSCPEHLLFEITPPLPPFDDTRPSEPLHQLVPPGVRIPIRSSCAPRCHGEVPCIGTLARPSSGELRPHSTCGSIMDRKHHRSTAHGLGPPFFLCKINQNLD
jgi:hypothetical protein